MNDSEESPFLAAALDYAKRGWSVLPLLAKSKRPLVALVPNGFQNATTNEKIIRQWWTRYPNANVGIRTGGEACLVVLDIDPRSGGNDNLWHLEKEHGELPDTVRSLTGGGGAHIFFLHPGGIIKNKTLSSGVEVKADGGYVVAPPSIHPSGEPYRWESACHPEDVSLVAMPEWLFRLMSRQSSSQNGPRQTSYSEGSRHKFLMSLAGAMRRKGMDEEAIRQALMIANRLQCNPPLDASEVNQIARSAARYEPARDGTGTCREEWPQPLAKEAYHGLLGDIVSTIDPHTEADLAAILVQTLVAFGNVLNRRPHFRVEGDTHALNLYAVLVGETAKGRKGTSWGRVQQLFQMADADWSSQRIFSGLSSGEGLIWHVRDPIYKEQPIKEKREIVGYETVRVDPGVEDKRMLVYVSELALVLRHLQRDGNTLSAIIRQAWDNGNLRVLTKNDPVAATGAHISIIGHITRNELRRYLDETETANGFANRFLWVCARRSKCLPEGGQLRDEDLEPLVRRLVAAIQFGRLTGPIGFDDRARRVWCEIYPDLSAGRAGLLGAVVSRADPLARRVSCLYALLDQSPQIRVEHLYAGLEVWRYCHDSARYIFGSAVGDEVADKILKALRRQPEGMTRTDINALFSNNRSGSDIDRALDSLLNMGLIRSQEEVTPGRFATRWFANGTSTTETI